MGAGPGNVTLQPEQSEKIIYPEVYSSRQVFIKFQKFKTAQVIFLFTPSQSHVTVVVGGPASK